MSQEAHFSFCRNCFQFRKDHVDGKCMFDSTMFDTWTPYEWTQLGRDKRFNVAEKMLDARPRDFTIVTADYL
jgi:hypothetical protein